MISAVAILSFLPSPSVASTIYKITVRPEQTGVSIPVSLDVPAGNWRLEDASSGRAIPCQMDKDTGALWLMLETPRSDASIKRTLRLVADGETPRGGFRIENTGKQIVLQEGDKPVLAFNYAMMLPEGVREDRRRSCYIHPLYGVNGEVLSDDFPKDHYHHRGLFWAWTGVKMGGKTYDLWTIKGLHQRFEKLISADLGPVYGKLVVQDGWYTADGTRIMDEVITVKAYKAGAAGRIVDFELEWTSVSQPVTLDSSGTGYGGFSLRFASRKDTVVYTSKGKEEGDVNRVQFEWSDLSAKFGESPDFSGVTIVDNPGNPVYPTAWSNRYYGFLNPSFTGVRPVTIEPGEPLVFRYRLWIHKGDALSGSAGPAYQVYVKPPSVKAARKGDQQAK